MNDAHRSEVEPIGYVPVPEGYVSHSRLGKRSAFGPFCGDSGTEPA